ncbi:MAG: ABC transporter substrate-binding protein [Alphaproteobacteria bacterium]
MKKLFAITLSVLIFSNVAHASINAKKAEDFVKKMTTTGIEELVNSNLSASEKTKKFTKLFEEYFDLDFIGKFVLGRYYRTATPEEKKSFIAAYKEYNVRTWSGRFDEFKGKSFDFKGSSASNSASQIFVDTEVDMGDGSVPAKVVWRVLEEKDGAYKVVDIVIENVSLAVSARSEYTSFLKNNGGSISALIKKLDGNK